MTPDPTVACCVVTNRPDWHAFALHQVKKQSFHGKFLVWEAGDVASIPEKRTACVKAALEAEAEYLAWFDDDDWSSPERLAVAVRALQADPELDAVGNVRSWFISTDTKRGLEYQAPEGIIFNGAVFRTSRVPENFSRALQTGEDTDWLLRWFRRKPKYMILGAPQHAWLCHRKNVTNRVDTRAFDATPPELLTTEEWAMAPT